MAGEDFVEGDRCKPVHQLTTDLARPQHNFCCPGLSEALEVEVKQLAVDVAVFERNLICSCGLRC